jgi:hypothetical protein
MPKRDRRTVRRYSPDEKEQSTAVQEDAPLSPQRAFVVQFRTTTEQTPGCLTGRAEHMTSGQAVRFSSAEELLAFIARVLTQVLTEPSEKP